MAPLVKGDVGDEEAVRGFAPPINPPPLFICGLYRSGRIGWRILPNIWAITITRRRGCFDTFRIAA